MDPSKPIKINPFNPFIVKPTSSPLNQSPPPENSSHFSHDDFNFDLVNEALVYEKQPIPYLGSTNTKENPKEEYRTRHRKVKS